MFTFGFYNSLGGDRKYNSVQISRLFEGIINDGVFASIGDSLMVTDGAGGMTVNVGTGRAWFNNTWNDNDAIMPIALDASEAILNRIDAIVLEVKDASDVRTNSIKKITGTPGSVPAAPVMINTTGHHQYTLATIAVNAGVTEITSAMITNKVGTVDCPFVTVVGLDALLPVWENEFDVWFAALQAQMAGDVATNLQNQITTNLNNLTALITSTKSKYGTCATAAATAAKVVTQAEFSLVAGVIIGVSFTNVNTAVSPTLNVNGTGAKAIYCNGSASLATKIPKMAAFLYDGTYYQLLNPIYVATDVLLSSTVQGYYGGLTSVEAALKNYVKKDTVVVLTTSGSWTPPRSNMLIDVFMIGGGGGAGGSGGSSSYHSGGAGGGFVKFLKDLPITSVTPIPHVIGAGGIGGEPATSGTDGGETSFGPYRVKGGSGTPMGNTGNGGDGGAGGGSGYTGEGGAGGSYGSDGRPGSSSKQGKGGLYSQAPLGGYCPINSTVYGGGGGGGSTTTGGAGGAGGGGAGAADANGGAATNYGGGGGGCGGSGRTGGNGYQGLIVIGYNS